MRSVQLLIAVSLVGGCGVSNELYEQRGAEITRLTRELGDAKKMADDERAACATKLGSSEKGRKEDLAAAERRLAELKAQAEARQRQFAELAGKLQKMVDAGKLKVEVRNGQMLVKMSDAILFDSGKADLKSEGKATLKELAAALSGIAGRRFQVAGHTDDEPLSKKSRFKDNWSLSTARAVEVVNFMIKDGGLPGERLSAAGWADKVPLAKNDSEEGRKQNRRIEVVLLPNIDELPALTATK